MPAEKKIRFFRRTWIERARTAGESGATPKAATKEEMEMSTGLEERTRARLARMQAMAEAVP